MAGQIDICNQALRLVGAKTILSLSDDIQEAKDCALFYEDSRKAVLSETAWTFAQKRTTLAADTTAPAWGYDFRFKLPTDFVKLTEYNRSKLMEGWVIEDGYLLSDDETPEIRYTYLAPEGNYSSEFVKALAAYLARELAASLAEDKNKVTQMEQLYQMRLDIAQNRDGQQNANRKIQTEGVFKRSRRTMYG